MMLAHRRLPESKACSTVLVLGEGPCMCLTPQGSCCCSASWNGPARAQSGRHSSHDAQGCHVPAATVTQICSGAPCCAGVCAPGMFRASMLYLYNKMCSQRPLQTISSRRTGPQGSAYQPPATKIPWHVRCGSTLESLSRSSHAPSRVPARHKPIFRISFWVDTCHLHACSSDQLNTAAWCPSCRCQCLSQPAASYQAAVFYHAP